MNSVEFFPHIYHDKSSFLVEFVLSAFLKYHVTPDWSQVRGSGSCRSAHAQTRSAHYLRAAWHMATPTVFTILGEGMAVVTGRDLYSMNLVSHSIYLSCHTAL